MKIKVESFIEALNNDNPGVEAVTLYQNGSILLEHRFVPYHERPIYSHTKSFAVTLAGIAIDENKLRLDDKLVDFFPEYKSVITDERMYQIELKHLLTMSSGLDGRLLVSAGRRTGEGLPDYVAYLLSQTLRHNVGERFLYSNADSHLIACMVERAVGEKFQKYAYEKLFSKIDMGYPAWEATPSGTPFCGSGMYLGINDMMKIGILYLNNGVWNGEKIVSADWVRSATKRQILTGASGGWSDSYGYQFWVIDNPSGVYRADGAYGQCTIIVPDKNAVLATQSSEYNNTEKFTAMLRKYVFDVE